MIVLKNCIVFLSDLSDLLIVKNPNIKLKNIKSIKIHLPDRNGGNTFKCKCFVLLPIRSGVAVRSEQLNAEADED